MKPSTPGRSDQMEQYTTSYIDDLYENDPHQIKNFMDVSNIFKLDYSVVPLGVKVLVFPWAALFIFGGLFNFYNFISRPNLMFIVMSLILIFIGLKIVQGTAVYHMRNSAKVRDFSLLSESPLIKNDPNMSYRTVGTESLINSLQSMYQEVFRLAFSVFNTLRYSGNNKEIVVGEIVSSRSSSSTGATRNENGFVFFISEKEIPDADMYHKNQIADWVKEHFHFSLTEYFDLADVHLHVKNNAVLLLFPHKFRAPEVAYQLLRITETCFYH